MVSSNSSILQNNYKIKSKRRIFVFSLRKNLISIIFIVFTLSLVIFSKSNLVAAKSGLKLWANNVVPSLFPFFIATNLLSHTNIIKYVSKIFNKIMRPIFNVPGESAYAFILGLISGYPVGAKIVTNLRNSSLCTKDEGNRMLCFTNNSGPLFIIGTVGITFFANSSVGILLLISHVLSAITVGIILAILSRFKCANSKDKSSSYIPNVEKENSTKTCTFLNLGEILSDALMESAKTIIMIGGFVVIFSVIISILTSSKIIYILSNLLIPIFNIFRIDGEFTNSLISGLIELTNGVSQVASIPNKTISINILFSSFLLGFGGLSVLLQVLAIISKSDLSIKPYFYGKLMQGIFAVVYTYILLTVFPFFNLNLWLDGKVEEILIKIYAFYRHSASGGKEGMKLIMDKNSDYNYYGVPPFGNINMNMYDSDTNGCNGINMDSQGIFNPFMQYEQAYMYYRYLAMQMEYKIKCKEFENLSSKSNGRDANKN